MDFKQGTATVYFQTNQNDSKLLYTNLLYSIKDNMSKCFYKRIIMTLSFHKELCYSNKQLVLYKIRSILKIIERKFKKHICFIEPHIKSINYWLRKVYKDLNLVITKFNKEELNLNYHDQEKVIEYYLIYMYHKCTIMLLTRDIPQLIPLLGICMSQIDDYLPYIINPKILLTIQKLLIIVINVNMQNCNHQKSLPYIKKATDLGIRVVMSQTKINMNDKMILLNNPYKNNLIKKAIKNIIVLFLHKGICEEESGKITTAIRWYKNSHWIASKFLEKDELFEEFTKRIIKKSLEIRDLLGYLMNINRVVLERKRLIFEKKNKMNQTNKFKPTLSFGDYIDYEKYQKAENKISNLKIPDIEIKSQNEKKSNKNNYLSSLHLIDAYLSDDFKEFVNSSKKFPIVDIDNNTLNKIEKILRNSKKKKKFLEKNITNSNLLCLNTTSQKNTMSMASIQTKKNISFQPLISNYNSFNSSISLLKKDNINKSSFEYSASFKKKKRYLNDLNTKELKFQKELLNFKKTEIQYKEIIDKYQTVQEADFHFQQLMNCQSHLLNNQGNKIEPCATLKEIKRLKNCMSLENQALKSLSPTILNKYIKERKRKATVSKTNNKQIKAFKTMSSPDIFSKKKLSQESIKNSSIDYNDTFQKFKSTYDSPKRLKNKTENKICLRIKSI